MEVISQALHMPAALATPRPVPIEDPTAGILLVALKQDDTPPFIAVIDATAAGRACHGTPAIACMGDVVSWAYEVLPAAWLEPEDALWVCVGPERTAYLMEIGPLYKIKWTPVAWPNCVTGSLRALCAAQPAYAGYLMHQLEELGECI